jgi:hypothetical protein
MMCLSVQTGNGSTINKKQRGGGGYDILYFITYCYQAEKQ